MLQYPLVFHPLMAPFIEACFFFPVLNGFTYQGLSLDLGFAICPVFCRSNLTISSGRMTLISFLLPMSWSIFANFCELWTDCPLGDLKIIVQVYLAAYLSSSFVFYEASHYILSHYINSVFQSSLSLLWSFFAHCQRATLWQRWILFLSPIEWISYFSTASYCSLSTKTPLWNRYYFHFTNENLKKIIQFLRLQHSCIPISIKFLFAF